MRRDQDSVAHDTAQGHDFGTLLKLLRVGKHVKQITIVALLPGWSRTSYLRLENGELPPRFDQLYALYRAFHLAGISFSVDARHQFLVLARAQIDKKKTHLDKHSDTEWAELHYQLARLDGSASSASESPSPAATTLHRPLLAETSHLLGREDWYEQLLSFVNTDTPKKLLIIRGPAGIGKSSELNWLATYLFRQRLASYRVLLCDFRAIERMNGPQAAFEVFLGTLLTELGSVQPQTAFPSWEERTTRVLELLEQVTRPLVILIDQSECILHDPGMLAPCWERFLTRFLRSKHLATLVFATNQWPSWYGGEQQFLAEIVLPPLPLEKGVLLLQHLGLEGVPVPLLQEAYRKTGGIPLALEWVATLVKQPLFADDWEAFTTFGQDNENHAHVTMTNALQRLFQEPHLFAGSVSDELAPFLERILATQRLSAEANALLQTLSVATIPLAKPALQVLCPQGSRPLKELRRASVLVAYPDRAQLLPLVAAAMYRQLTPEQIGERERQLISAYSAWMQAETFHQGEQGTLITELATLQLKQHHLLDAAQLLIRYGWLSFNMGYAPRLAKLAQNVMKKCNWHTTDDNEVGGLLLHNLLTPFLGETIDTAKQCADYLYIHKVILSGKVVFQSATEGYVTNSLMMYAMDKLRFEDALGLLEVYYSRLAPLRKDALDLQVSLLETRAWCFGKWSEHALEHGDLLKSRELREQAISLYKQCTILLSTCEAASPLKNRLLKRQLAYAYNNLSYHLHRSGQLKEALQMIEHAIVLREHGYAEANALAVSYGEKSEILTELGRFQEALIFDEKALQEIQHHASTGHTLSQEEVWIYRINRGRLHLRLGKRDEAEQLLREALPHVPLRRRTYRMFAEDALNEIEQWKQSGTAHYQLDWRWIERYRELDSFDAYWWWAQAGPFNEEEQQQWDNLYTLSPDEARKEHLGRLIAQSRDCELTAAISEQREPQLLYPAIDINDVRRRIAALQQLDREIHLHEPNAIVRHLYHETIEEEMCFIRIIEATYEKNSEQFWQFSRCVYPEPTLEEMNYVLARVWQLVQQGLQHSETGEISQHLLQFWHQRLGLPQDFSSAAKDIQERQQGASLLSSDIPPRMVTAQVARRFFEVVLRENGYEGWQVVLDKASTTRVESGLRKLFLADRPMSVEDVRYYLIHELGGHVARASAGEHSLLGLLGIGTKNYSPTEEGLAQYHERELAILQGKTVRDLGTWLGTLSTGLASGVVTPPQTFLSLFTFLESFFLLYRLLNHRDTNRAEAEQQARKTALANCLRTYRGVPDLQKAGVCLSKDVVYLRGLWLVERAVAQDRSILDRLAVGKVAIEYLSDLQELGIVTPSQSFIKLAHAPNLDSYILSFAESEE